MRILVFLPGTAIMHRTAVGRPRAEQVRRSLLPEAGQAIERSGGWLRERIPVG